MSNRKKRGTGYAEAVKRKPWLTALIPAQEASGSVVSPNSHLSKKAYGKPANRTTKSTATTYPASGKSSASDK